MKHTTSLVRCYTTATTMSNNLYQLIGGELSPYTAKVRFYLRHKQIPFEPVQSTIEVYSKVIKPHVGWGVVPVLVTPQKQYIQDSCDIISKLEKWHPNPTVQPTSPKHKILSVLMEMFFDEWLVLPIMHYRWSFPENMKFLSEEFGRITFPRESTKDRSNIAEMSYKRFKNMLPILGVTEKTSPEIERSWKDLQDELSTHFDQHPYLLGGKPCIADFSLAGMAYAHLFRDPVPGYLMKTKAPVFAAWIEHMNGHLPHANRLFLHDVDDDGCIVRENLPPEKRDYYLNDEIPETLIPILRRFFIEFAPILFDTKSLTTKFIQENVTSQNTKLPRNLGLHPFTIGGVTEKRGVFPFYLWKWQRVTDLYCSLSDVEKKSVNDLMAQFPHGLDVIQADLKGCRVERINNFLHAVVPAKARM